jgi:arabinogalactan oligomer/maltooligosaccharide transport system substrate-binding protein
MIPSSPEDTELLFEHNLEAAPLSSNLSAYFLTGFFGSFGASLLDDEGRCIVDQTRGVEALWYLKELKESGALIIPEYAEAERLFLDRESGMIINGPWAINNYREHFQDALGYISLPVGPGGLARPLLNFRGLFVNPNSGNVDAAVALIKFLSSQEASQTFSDVALQVPARWDVEMRDPIQQGFFDEMDHGDLSMKSWEFDSYWEPFNQMFIDVLEGGADPGAALEEACAVMNERNGK